MSRSTRTWGTIAVTSAALLGAAAPAARATPPVPTAPVSTNVAKTTCTTVELKWPNGTGTGVWRTVCS